MFFYNEVIVYFISLIIILTRKFLELKQLIHFLNTQSLNAIKTDIY